MRRKTLLGIMLSLLFMLTLTFSIQRFARAQKDKIVIGVAQSYTGVNAAGCMMHQLYYDMIIEDWNAKGGLDVPGYGLLPIELLPIDDESDIEKCLTAIEKLITQDNVDLMFAPWSTEFNVAAFSLFEQYQMPAIGLTVGSDEAAEAMKSGEVTYSFVCLGQPYEDAIEIVDMFEYINENIATEETQISTIGIIYRADLHGTEHSTAIGDALTAAGFTVSVKEAYPLDISTFVPLINQLSDADVDVVMISGYGEAATFVYECMALDYNPKMMFHGPVLETPLMMYAVFGFTPGQITGLTYYDGFPATAYLTPTLKAWADEHKARTGFYPFPAAAPAFYTGIEILFQAVEQVGLNHTAIRDALATQTWNTSLMGMARFRVGQSIEVEGCGTLTQWQGKEMMEVIWPLDQASANIIYPKYPWSWAAMPDLNRDGKVGILDLYLVAAAFGCSPGDPRWDWVADVDKDDYIGIKDVYAVAKEFGETL